MTQQPQPLADRIREEILAALSSAGAFCGACDFEPGEIGCADCVRVRELYADALTPITDRLRAELQQAQQQTAQLAALLRAGQSWRAGRLVAESRYSATEIRAIFGWPEPTRDGAPTETTHACATEYCDEFDPATCLVTPAAVSGA